MKFFSASCIFLSLLACLGLTTMTSRAEEPKKIVFLAGTGSHGFGAHAHYAGCQILAKALTEAMPDKLKCVVSKGWPADPAQLDGAATIVVYCDGGGLINDHLEQFDKLMKSGAGLVCIHYTLDPGKAETCAKLREWIGGCYEQNWSINPSWIAKFKEIPTHPVTRGVKPFTIHDEWYYHMRFQDEMKGVTPILTAVPPDATRKHADGPHSGNPTVRSRMGQPEHVGWAYDRPEGGRGFGTSAGHVHWNWAHNDLRKLLLNAIAWTAHLEVPAEGVPSKQPTVEELIANQDSPMPGNWKPEMIQQFIDDFNKPADK